LKNEKIDIRISTLFKIFKEGLEEKSGLILKKNCSVSYYDYL